MEKLKTCSVCGNACNFDALFDASGTRYEQKMLVCEPCIRENPSAYPFVAAYVVDVCRVCGAIGDDDTPIYRHNGKKCQNCLIAEIGPREFNKRYKRVSGEPDGEVKEIIKAADQSKSACSRFVKGAYGGCAIAVDFGDIKSHAIVIGVARGLGRFSGKEVLWVRYATGMVSCMDEELGKQSRCL